MTIAKASWICIANRAAAIARLEDEEEMMACLWLDPESEKEQQEKVERRQYIVGEFLAAFFMIVLLLSMAVLGSAE